MVGVVRNITCKPGADHRSKAEQVMRISMHEWSQPTDWCGDREIPVIVSASSARGFFDLKLR
jgi:hypothetical protein